MYMDVIHSINIYYVRHLFFLYVVKLRTNFTFVFMLQLEHEFKLGIFQK